MAQAKDVTGLVFGRLTARNKEGKDKFGIALWKCRCECGNETVVRLCALSCGYTRSCGCLNNETRKVSMRGNTHAKVHSLSKHPLYPTWSTMKQRCINPNQGKYALYGGRGIKVCDEWMNSFPKFLEDMGERPEGCTLNRIDNDGNYCKDNCEWATHSDQNRNRRAYKRNTGLFNELQRT
jgi:hypothetical protein